MLNFYIGEAGMVGSAIINYALTPVNKSFVPQFLECLICRSDDFFV